MNRNFKFRNGSTTSEGFRHHTKPKAPKESLMSILGHDINYNDTTNYNPLFLAVHNGKLKVTHSLLKEGSLQNEVSGRKLIHIAAARGHEQIICLLCQRNAEVDKGDKEGNTPLHLAIKGNHTDVVNLLLNKLNVNLKNLNEATPLHVATEMDNLFFVDLLLKNGADVHEEDVDGKTALHISAGKLNPKIEIIMILLAYGASVHASCKKGFTPLHYVATSGNVKITEVLINRDASVFVTDSKGISPLCLAIQKNKTEMVKYILKKQPIIHLIITNKMAPLHFAAETGNEEIVKLLVTEGGNNETNAKGEGLKTPLHFSAANGHINVLKYLIECNAQIDLKTNDGSTPLHLSATAGHLEIVRELLNHGAKIDSQTNDGNTPLHLSAAAGHLDIVRELLIHRAEIDSANNEGFTPLYLAVKTRKKEVVSLLVKEGANNSGRICDRKSSLYSLVQYLGTGAIDVLPAFHVAAKVGDEEILKILLNTGIEVDLKSKNDKTALHFAATCGHIKLVEELIKAGASINSLTKFNETPLHLAAASGRSSTVKYLLNSGAHVQTRTIRGHTPLHYVLDRERHEALINPKKTPISHRIRMNRLLQVDNNSAKDVVVTPFWFEKYLNITEMLLIKGNPTETYTPAENSLLHYAQIKVSKQNQERRTLNTRQEDIIEGEFRPEILRCLLNYGVNLDFNEFSGIIDSPLTKAIKLKASPVVDVLLEYDINNQRFDYPKALELAQKKGDLNIILALAEKIFDIDDIVNLLCNVDISPTSSIKFLKKDNLKLLIAILVKIRSISKIDSAVQSRELKLLETEKLDEWYTQCELEVMNMREKKIHQQFDITFFDILTKPVSKLAKYTRNKNLMRTLDSGIYKQFAAYAPFLERSIEKGKERKDLIESSIECFFNLIRQHCKIQLPSLVVDKIFMYFSVTELRKLSSTFRQKPYHCERPACGFRAVRRK